MNNLGIDFAADVAVAVSDMPTEIQWRGMRLNVVMTSGQIGANYENSGVFEMNGATLAVESSKLNNRTPKVNDEVAADGVSYRIGGLQKYPDGTVWAWTLTDERA